MTQQHRGGGRAANSWSAGTRAVGALPDAQRRVVVLAYYGGYTPREIASLIGTSLGTVKSRMRRAIHNLRHLLGDGEEPAGLEGGIRPGVPEAGS